MTESQNNKTNYLANPLVNPIGHGLQLCLAAMKDCNESGDKVGYRKWADMGLKYVDLQMDGGRQAISAPSTTSMSLI